MTTQTKTMLIKVYFSNKEWKIIIIILKKKQKQKLRNISN